MEDKKIRQLFNNFQPGLPSSRDFMHRLHKNMDMVESLRQYNIALRRRNRIAVVIAAVCGFIFGVVTMLLLNPIVSILSEITLYLPFIHTGALSIDTGFVAWTLIAAVSILSALHAYDIAMSRLSPGISSRK